MFSAYISMVMICLVLWNMNGFWLSIQLGISSSQLTKSIIFPRGRSTTNQWWFLHIYNFWWSSKWIDGGVRFRIYPHELVISEYRIVTSHQKKTCFFDPKKDVPWCPCLWSIQISWLQICHGQTLNLQMSHLFQDRLFEYVSIYIYI